jgi:hypothetical protein
VTYLFRLTMSAKRPGIFRFDSKTVEAGLTDQFECEVVARDADVLSLAQKVHFEGRGFSTEQAARVAGERLRLRLRVLNAILGLGVDVPVTDSTGSRSNEEFKKELTKEHDVVIVDGIVGLEVLPDDGRHLELVFTGEGEAHPSKPEYILTALNTLWSLDLRLDDSSEDALNIVNAATQETSDRAAFLITYLALESLVGRKKRSAEAQEVLRGLIDLVKGASLPEEEKVSLVGSLGRLWEESFGTTLRGLAASIQEPKELMGRPLIEFVSDCVNVRNQVAHRASLGSHVNLSQMTAGLRKLILTIIWTVNQIPSLSIDVPASQFTLKAKGTSIRLI